MAKVRRGVAMISPERLKLKRTDICMPSRALSAGGGDQQERSAANRSPMVSRSWSGFWYFAASSCGGTVSIVSCRFWP